LLQAGAPLLASNWLRLVVTLVALLLFTSAMTVNLVVSRQSMFGILCVVVALVLNRIRGRIVTVSMVALSAFVSLRYLYWRLTQTLSFTNPLDRSFGYLLLLAEGYAVLMLLCSYFHCDQQLRCNSTASADLATDGQRDIPSTRYRLCERPFAPYSAAENRDPAGVARRGPAMTP
jgi:hypothetical protein